MNVSVFAALMPLLIAFGTLCASVWMGRGVMPAVAGLLVVAVLSALWYALLIGINSRWLKAAVDLVTGLFLLCAVALYVAGLSLLRPDVTPQEVVQMEMASAVVNFMRPVMSAPAVALLVALLWITRAMAPRSK